MVEKVEKGSLEELVVEAVGKMGTIESQAIRQVEQAILQTMAAMVLVEIPNNTILAGVAGAEREGGIGGKGMSLLELAEVVVAVMSLAVAVALAGIVKTMVP